MQVLPKQAITRRTRGVVSEPVIEIEADQIKSVESQPGAKGELPEVGRVCSRT